MAVKDDSRNNNHCIDILTSNWERQASRPQHPFSYNLFMRMPLAKDTLGDSEVPFVQGASTREREKCSQKGHWRKVEVMSASICHSACDGADTKERV